MSKKQSNSRSAKRSQSFKEQVNAEKRKIRKNKMKLPIWKKILVFITLPIMYAIWVVDGACHFLLPHADHPSLKNYMVNPASLKLTFFRVLIFGIPATVIALIF